MAMMTCPECKNSVSDQADKCIHCGFPIKKLRPSNIDKGVDFMSSDQGSKIFIWIAQLFRVFSSKEIKSNIKYQSSQNIDQIHEEVKEMKIASYKYIGSDSPVLGLILEDINPDSILRDEESINLYTYTTMCVAAIQVQSKEIKKLKDEIEQLKSNN